MLIPRVLVAVARVPFVCKRKVPIYDSILGNEQQATIAFKVGKKKTTSLHLQKGLFLPVLSKCNCISNSIESCCNLPCKALRSKVLSNISGITTLVLATEEHHHVIGGHGQL